MRLQVFAAARDQGTIVRGPFASEREALLWLQDLDRRWTAAEIFDLDDAPWNPPLRVCWREADAWYSIACQRIVPL